MKQDIIQHTYYTDIHAISNKSNKFIFISIFLVEFLK